MKTKQWITGLLLTVCTPSLYAAGVVGRTNASCVINSDTTSVAVIENNTSYHKPLHKLGVDISSAYVYCLHMVSSREKILPKSLSGIISRLT